MDKEIKWKDAWAREQALRIANEVKHERKVKELEEIISRLSKLVSLENF
jgi:hypothetical protein